MDYKEVLQLVEYPSEVLVLDFETYFDQHYGFEKMSTIEYIQHRLFEFTGVGFQILNNVVAGDSPPVFVFKPDVAAAIQTLQKNCGQDFDSVTVVAHNCKFDVTILKEKFGINPPYVIDIKDLAKHYDSRMSSKLKDLAKMFGAKIPGLKPKGDTMRFKGLHYEDMDTIQKEALKVYGLTDITDEAALFKILLPLLSCPITELKLARHTLDLFLNPRISFDFRMSTELCTKMEAELDNIVKQTDCSKTALSGNKSFVQILNDILPEGEEVPMKQGKNKMIPALAQNDDGCKYLLAHSNARVRQMMAARKAIKSWPLHIKRIQNMTNQAIASGGYLRVPLHYYGGHTGRWSGGEKINLQNLGGRGRTGTGVHPLIAQMRGLLHA